VSQDARGKYNCSYKIFSFADFKLAANPVQNLQAQQKSLTEQQTRIRWSFEKDQAQGKVINSI
jgi:glutathione peroxidase-family protein